MAAFLAIALALSSIGAGIVVVASSGGRIGLPASDRSAHRFLALRPDGTPVRWDPCQPVHYVVNLGGAPPGSLDDVHEATRRISEATGIRFVFDGTTDEELTGRRSSFVADLYPGEWAPILVAWVEPGEGGIDFELGHRTAIGMARPIPEFQGTDSSWVSGWIAMNEADGNPPGWNPGDQGPVLLHEFGHIAGLDHVRDAGEIMAPMIGWMTDLGPGDREGLRLLGREQGCLDFHGPLE